MNGEHLSFQVYIDLLLRPSLLWGMSGVTMKNDIWETHLIKKHSRQLQFYMLPWTCLQVQDLKCPDKGAPHFIGKFLENSCYEARYLVLSMNSGRCNILLSMTEASDNQSISSWGCQHRWEAAPCSPSTCPRVLELVKAEKEQIGT